MNRMLLTTLALGLMSSGAFADYLLILDPTRLNAAVATRGVGPDGRLVRPRSVAAACMRDGVFGPAAFSPRRDRCRAAEAVPGLRDSVAELPVAGTEPGTTVFDLVTAGGIVAVEPRLRLACRPGDCSRELFEGGTYPASLVGRPDPPPLANPQISLFAVEPEMLTAGQTATVSWVTNDVASCRLETSGIGGPWTVSASGEQIVMPAEDTFWTLTCAALGGTAIAQTLATVSRPSEAPAIIFFESLRDDVPVGGRTTLVWETRQAVGCALDDGSGPVPVPASARMPVFLDEDTRFVLDCQNAQGWISSTTEVLVTTATQAPTIETFDVDRSEITRGDGLYARWQAPGATRCRLRDGVQTTSWRLAPAGQLRLAPAMTTEYTLTCRNAYGFDRADITVTVDESGEPVRVSSFELTMPSGQRRTKGGTEALQLTQPGLVRLNWATEGAIACRIADDAGRETGIPVNGSRIIRVDETTALQINCVSRSGEARAFNQARLLREGLFSSNFES